MMNLNTFIRPNDNPDLTEERKKATFNTDHLSVILYDGFENLKRRREIAEYFECHPELHDPVPVEFMSRGERFENINKKLLPWMKHMKAAIDVNNQQEMKYFENLVMGTDGHPLGIHFIMGIPAILNNSDEEQLKKWLPKVMNNEFILAYAQTELGHGTNLKHLETTATFDFKTEEFVLNSPTVTSIKWWPGNLGKSSNWSIVMAQLIIGNKNYGPHPFFVQIRDEKTHESFPGLEVGDIGPKFGLDSNDNGFLRFNNFRIPRTSMMMKIAKVLPDGKYIPAIHPKLGYLTMIVVRAAVVTVASEFLSKACTIATRYSLVRRQGEIIPGAGEVKILDYQTQQYRIFPQIARAFAFRFSGIYLLEINNKIAKELENGNTENLADLHAIASGIKAVVTFQTSLGIEQCRMSCGGHGYSLVSGLPQIYAAGVGGCTYEGENMVLLLQLAKFLRKQAEKIKNGKNTVKISSMANFLFKVGPKNFRIGIANVDENNFEIIYENFEHVAKRLIFETFEKTESLQTQGSSLEVAMNQTAVDWRRASHAFTRVIITRIFREHVEKLKDSPTKNVLNQLLKLYLFYEVGETAAELLEDCFVDSQQINFAKQQVFDCLEKIRFDAISIVDSFDFTDQELNSVLGRRDEHVYENMLKWAKESTLNKYDVMPFHHKYLGKMMDDAKKKSKL